MPRPTRLSPSLAALLALLAAPAAASVACELSAAPPVEILVWDDAALARPERNWAAGTGWEVVRTERGPELRPIGPAGEIDLAGRAFRLESVHFHAPSPHALYGAASELEAHFVHRDALGGVVVLAATLAGRGTQGPLTAILAAMPGERGTATVGPLDPEALVPGDPTALRHDGAGIADCHPGADWLVLLEPMAVAPAEIAGLRALLPSDPGPAAAPAAVHG